MLTDFSTTRILVLGDLMLDRYWYGATSRISPEAPVPIVHVKDMEERAGGAGNVAYNLAALQAQASLIGVCGADEAGDTLVQMVEQAGVKCMISRSSVNPTITKLRVLSRHQQLIRLDFEEDFNAHRVDTLLDLLARSLPESDVLILSDYGKGTLNGVKRFIEAAKEHDVPILIDPKGNDFTRYSGATLITPNLSEFEAIVGACKSDDELIVKGREMLHELHLKALLITRGEQGMVLIENSGNVLTLPASAREVFDVTGAGDTVISTLAAGLAAGNSLSDAVRLSNAAAGIVVGKLGTATLTPDELESALVSAVDIMPGIVDEQSLLEAMRRSRINGERIVATNGCFDILHTGHLRYLKQARALGDRLVVLVNSDESVRRLKGAARPLNSLSERMEMLAGLACVDWVISFSEDTPAELYAKLLPDILVKGGDYQSVESIAGHEAILANGGEVKLLDLVEGRSTTALIDRILEVSH